MTAFSTPEAEAMFPLGPAMSRRNEVKALAAPSPADEGMSFLKTPVYGASTNLGKSWTLQMDLPLMPTRHYLLARPVRDMLN